MPANNSATPSAPIQSNYERHIIVQNYLENTADQFILLVCLMYMRGCDDRSVCRSLRLRPKQLTEIKAKIAKGLLEAGIIPRI